MDFIYDNNGRPYAFIYDGTTFFYILNLQGDVIRIVNSAGVTAASYAYDAWGNLAGVAGAYAEINPIRYRGYYFDSETGLYYLQSRYYDPTVKRFVNADLLANTGQGFVGSNMFAYCGNSPANNTDSSGNLFFTALGAVIGGVTAYAESKFKGGDDWTSADGWDAAMAGALGGAISGAGVDAGLAVAAATGGAGAGFAIAGFAGFVGGFVGAGFGTQWKADWSDYIVTGLISGGLNMVSMGLTPIVDVIKYGISNTCTFMMINGMADIGTNVAAGVAVAGTTNWAATMATNNYSSAETKAPDIGPSPVTNSTSKKTNTSRPSGSKVLKPSAKEHWV